ncbi:flagellar hook-length control protein FliK [Puniceibacterium confluentis]|uniref:flagellar hook-length control protein FliK n=2 Tax=Puniceibacterium confluentis TaxID=1958944 RepID=UPI0016476E03|nr:flagellar hook-length control protein FliK [Puniceibacterium confluentis]
MSEAIVKVADPGSDIDMDRNWEHVSDSARVPSLSETEPPRIASGDPDDGDFTAEPVESAPEKNAAVKDAKTIERQAYEVSGGRLEAEKPETLVSVSVAPERYTTGIAQPADRFAFGMKNMLKHDQNLGEPTPGAIKQGLPTAQDVPRPDSAISDRHLADHAVRAGGALPIFPDYTQLVPRNLPSASTGQSEVEAAVAAHIRNRLLASTNIEFGSAAQTRPEPNIRSRAPLGVTGPLLPVLTSGRPESEGEDSAPPSRQALGPSLQTRNIESIRPVATSTIAPKPAQTPQVNPDFIISPPEKPVVASHREHRMRGHDSPRTDAPKQTVAAPQKGDFQTNNERTGPPWNLNPRGATWPEQGRATRNEVDSDMAKDAFFSNSNRLPTSSALHSKPDTPAIIEQASVPIFRDTAHKNLPQTPQSARPRTVGIASGVEPENTGRQAGASPSEPTGRTHSQKGSLDKLTGKAPVETFEAARIVRSGKGDSHLAVHPAPQKTMLDQTGKRPAPASPAPMQLADNAIGNIADAQPKAHSSNMEMPPVDVTATTSKRELIDRNQWWATSPLDAPRRTNPPVALQKPVGLGGAIEAKPPHERLKVKSAGDDANTQIENSERTLKSVLKPMEMASRQLASAPAPEMGFVQREGHLDKTIERSRLTGHSQFGRAPVQAAVLTTFEITVPFAHNEGEPVTPVRVGFTPNAPAAKDAPDWTPGTLKDHPATARPRPAHTPLSTTALSGQISDRGIASEVPMRAAAESSVQDSALEITRNPKHETRAGPGRSAGEGPPELQIATPLKTTPSNLASTTYERPAPAVTAGDGTAGGIAPATGTAPVQALTPSATALPPSPRSHRSVPRNEKGLTDMGRMADTGRTVAKPAKPTPKGIPDKPRILSTGNAAAPGETRQRFDSTIPFLPAENLGGTQTFQSSGAPLPSRGEYAASVMRQVIEITGKIQDGPVELRLNPEELGRVRMHMASADQGIMLHITSERPETLDLLRRHIDQLRSEFSDLGYTSVEFTFGQHSDGSKQPQGGATEGGRQSSGTAGTATTVTEAVPSSPLQDSRDELDIRL